MIQIQGRFDVLLMRCLRLILDNERQVLQQEVEEKRKFQNEVLRLQTDIFGIRKQLHEAEDALQTTNREIEKEKVKNTNLSSHDQVLPIKRG